MRTGHARHVVLLDWRDPWHPETGGAQLYLHEVATRLVRDGYRVTWLTAGYDGAAPEEVRDGIRFLRRGGRLTVFVRVVLMLLLRRVGRFDAVLEVQNGMPFLAGLVTRRPVTVLVHHVHREQWSVVGPALARVGWFLESKVAVRLNRGRRYVAVSDTTRRDLAALGVRSSDITIALNGLPPIPDYAAGPRAAVPTIVALSRLVPHKQIDHLISALPALARDFPDVQLRVMGDGWWLPELQRAAHTTGVGDRVHFLGHVDERTKFEELSRGWVHVLPSVKEGWGIAIIEAGAAATPSIAYRSAGGVAEAILDGATGLLAADADDLSRQITAVLADPALRDELGRKAAVRAGELTWEATTARILDTML